MLNFEGILLPHFMEDMDEYLRCLDVIATTNHIDEFEFSFEDLPNRDKLVSKHAQGVR
jgi:hypothetical protein